MTICKRFNGGSHKVFQMGNTRVSGVPRGKFLESPLRVQRVSAVCSGRSSQRV